MAATFALRSVSLVTRRVERLLPFYRDTLGLVARRPTARTLTLHFTPEAPAVITFTENPSAREPVQRVAGLFHAALLVPDRPALAAVLARLVDHQQPLEGLSDHGVSEAIYLADPDGNGLEIYRDRPRADWPMNGEHVAMVTRALDPQGLLRDQPASPPAAPLAAATFGHIHLQVSNLAMARKFFTTELGLAVRQEDYPGALFFAADGYHHHVAVNTWGSPVPRGSDPLTGLAGYAAVSTRVRSPTRYLDPDGINLALDPLR